MNKEELLKYITQAVASLNEQDINVLFPDNAQPDLGTIVQEIIGLRGEVRKVAQSTLKLNHDVQSMLEQQKSLSLATPTPVVEKRTEEDIDKLLLQQLIEQNDIMQRTMKHFKDLPEVKWFNVTHYRQQMAAWRKGYEIAQEQWSNIIKNANLYVTGQVGEIFDPTYHEAIAVKNDPTQSNNVILQTELLGYIRNQKIIRRAKVIVNKLNN
jgi:molecular chaperone GrpE (heat shock protein)